MSTKPKQSADASILAVAYWRMSSSPQEKSIPQQKVEMTPRAKLENVTVIKDFEDRGISGGGMDARDEFREMVAFCEQENQARRSRKQPVIEAVVCFDTSRFSRADSNETAAYIWELRKTGVNRVFTWERWWDFRKEEDRAIFNLQQDFTNNRYLRDLSLRLIRGRKDVVLAGYFAGGQVPYGFDRILISPDGKPGQRFPRGQKIAFRSKGYRVALTPIEEDDPDPDRQLERQSVIWLFETFAGMNYSYRTLAKKLNDRRVPGPGAVYKRKSRKPTQDLWTVRGVKGILTNPVYMGTARIGMQSKGLYHRLVQGEIQAVEPTTPRECNEENAILRPMEFGGFVSAELFERVQAKAKERYVLKSSPRCDGYALPTGILHCGHCGGRMHGSTSRPKLASGVKEYRRYNCSTTRVKPGSCRDYSAAEADVVRLLVARMREDLREDVLADIERHLTAQAEIRHDRAPGEVERQKRRLVSLDADIKRGAQNLLRATEHHDVLSEALSQLRSEKEEIERTLAAASRRLDEPLDQVRGCVQQAIAALRRDREVLDRLAEGEPGKLSPDDVAALGEIVRQRVLRVDLYFDAKPLGKGGRTAYTLRKKIIKMKPFLELEQLEKVPGYETSGR